MKVHPGKYGYYKLARIVVPLLLLFVPICSFSQDDPVMDTIITTQVDTAYHDPSYYDTVPTPGEVSVDEASEEDLRYFNVKDSSGDSLANVIFTERKLGLATSKRYKDDAAFWYADMDFDQSEKEKQADKSRPLSAHPLFQTLLWVLIIGGFATFLALYLKNSNVGLFRRSRSIRGMEEDIETDDIFAINYQKEIDKATAAGNYRYAVRLHFLRVLKKLADAKTIDYKQDRTNFDYLLQLQPTKFYSDFFRLTRNYEYTWYGQFAIDAEKYCHIKQDFDNFDRKMR